MGYSADLLSIRTSDGEDSGPLVLLSANLPQVLTALHAAEAVLGSHISWCSPIAEYQMTNSDPETIVQILSDYGWGGTDIDPETGDVTLGWWNGDKLGSCWSEVLHAIAQGIDPALTITLFMSGEDGDLWAERLSAGAVETLQVRLEVVQP